MSDTFDHYCEAVDRMLGGEGEQCGYYGFVSKNLWFKNHNHQAILQEEYEQCHNKERGRA